MIGNPSNNLKKCREELGLSRDEVASAVQIAPKTLYRYETGRQCPNVYIALRLADCYHRPVRELFPGETG